ncbi:MAG: hypothetical protein AAGH68_07845, partial [Pseudomonadota bacterium]
MLSRGFYDAVVLWPVAFWPIVFSSCFFAYLKLCQTMRSRHGFSPIGGRRTAELFVTFIALPSAVAIELGTHGYMLMVAGYEYLVVAIPIYIFGWILLPSLLDGMRSGLPILAGTHLLFVSAFAVLLGFGDVGILRSFNSDLYGLLTGLPAVL